MGGLHDFTNLYAENKNRAMKHMEPMMSTGRGSAMPVAKRLQIR